MRCHDRFRFEESERKPLVDKGFHHILSCWCCGTMQARFAIRAGFSHLIP